MVESILFKEQETFNNIKGVVYIDNLCSTIILRSLPHIICGLPKRLGVDCGACFVSSVLINSQDSYVLVVVIYSMCQDSTLYLAKFG